MQSLGPRTAAQANSLWTSCVYYPHWTLKRKSSLTFQPIIFAWGIGVLSCPSPSRAALPFCCASLPLPSDPSVLLPCAAPSGPPLHSAAPSSPSPSFRRLSHFTSTYAANMRLSMADSKLVSFSPNCRITYLGACNKMRKGKRSQLAVPPQYLHAQSAANVSNPLIQQVTICSFSLQCELPIIRISTWGKKSKYEEPMTGPQNTAISAIENWLSKLLQ